LDAVLIRNPISGHPARQASLQRALAEFRFAGWRLDVRETERKGHARELAFQAVQEGYRTIIVAGGDGSIEQTVDGIIRAGVPDVRLGILPSGTGNVFARDVGLPFPENDNGNAQVKAAQVILEGDVVHVDVGLANGNAFLCWAGCGLDSIVADSVERNLEFKRRAPILTYAAEVVRQALQFQAPFARIEIDGGEVLEDHFGLIIVSNIVLYGRYFRVTPDAVMDDGYLEMVAMRTDALTSLAFTSAKLLLVPELPDDRLIRRRVRKLRIATAPSQVYHLDGDPLGRTPLAIEVLPRRLSVFLDRVAAAGRLSPDSVRPGKRAHEDNRA
jgi:diacylglycerol kinase (ATP)